MMMVEEDWKMMYSTAEVRRRLGLGRGVVDYAIRIGVIGDPVIVGKTRMFTHNQYLKLKNYFEEKRLRLNNRRKFYPKTVEEIL